MMRLHPLRRPETLLASVRTDAVAPYERRTHDCYFHSPTTCVGEQSGEGMHVTLTDGASGRTIVDGTRRSFDNGFIGLWLPRDITGTLNVEHEGATAAAPIATGDDDLTCLASQHLT